MATRLHSVVQVQLLPPERIRSEAPKADQIQQEVETPRSSKLPKQWSGVDPWEGVEYLADEDLEAFHADFQRKTGKEASRSCSSARWTGSTSCSSKASTASLQFSHDDKGDHLEEEEDDEWELDFMRRLEELSKKEAKKQGPSRHLGRQYIQAMHSAKMHEFHPR